MQSISAIRKENRKAVNQTLPKPDSTSSFDTFFDAIRYFSTTRPEHPALLDVSSGQIVTYQQLAARVEGLAGKLQARGVVVGDCVVLAIPRSALLVELVLATSRIGAFPVPYMSARDLKKALETVRNAFPPKLIITSQRYGGTVSSPHASEDWVGAEELDASTVCEKVNHVPIKTSILYVNETSGSMSVPKLVPASHAAIIANTEACVRTFGITSNDIHLCAFSSHSHEIFARALYTGGSAVLLADPIAENPNAFVDALMRYRVTCLMANPTAIRALADLSRDPPSNFALRIAEAGGVPVPDVLEHHVAEKFGAQILAVWGSTETSGVAIAPPDGRRKKGSVGTALPGYRVEIVDEDGMVVSPNNSGELLISGDGVANSYLSADNSRLNDRKFHTGDRAIMDEDGWVYICGRISNEFKVAGVVVSAERIEEALEASECVVDAAVFPVKHPIYGYVAAAFVVPANFDYRTADKRREKKIVAAITKTLDKHLSEPFFEFPSRVQWVDALPRNQGGKLDRRSLYQLYTSNKSFRTKLRQSRMKRLRHVVEMIGRTKFWRLLLQNPVGFSRLIRTLFRGEKAK